MTALQYHEARINQCANWVRCAWTLRGPNAGGDAEPIVSDGCVELVFNLSDPFERVVDGHAEIQPAAMVVGPTALPAVVRPTGQVDVVGIRLEPWAARAILPMPVMELRDRFVALEDLVPRRPWQELFERLHGTATWSDRCSHVSRALAQAIQPIDGCARDLVALVRRNSPVALGVRRLAAVAGRSVRAVERAFKEDVGLTAKTLMRLERMQRVLLLARARPHISWSSIAARCGFYDQPHLVHEFVSLVGCTPGEFRAKDDALTTVFLDADDTGQHRSPGTGERLLDQFG